MKKLFVIVREDLSPAQQGVQAVHAAVAFNVEHPEVLREWHEESNTLAFLSVPNEVHLLHLFQHAQQKGIAAAGFREPDRQDELTAIALGPRAKKLCARLSLALR